MKNWNFKNIDFSLFPFYEGHDLGVFLNGENLSVKIWAPGAKEIKFLVYRQSMIGEPIRIDSLTPGEKGCWSLQLKGKFAGYYYSFRVNNNGWMNEGWMNENPGIYARATGANGHRGLIFHPEETSPAGWDKDNPISNENPLDAILYELHIRDFSMSENSGMVNKGKYLAFTEEGTLGPEGQTTGIDHLKELGITHVHLLPVADYHSGDQRAQKESYNWGYNPVNYNVPEGSYATNPDDTSRITELKQLVMSLHKANIGVVLDVVYNHSGYTIRSWFNQTVPGYFYRQNSDGTFSNGSGCGNEIASERPMVKKFIIDSVCYWAKEYHIDGFRFDLMGLLDIETMNDIRAALDKLRPGILLYGEGWTAGESPVNERFRAVKKNVGQLNGIACFNDDFRNAVKGSDFIRRERGFVNGRIYNEESIKFGITAACYHPQIVYQYVTGSSFAWAREPYQAINYVSCHDNYTLFDKLKISRTDVGIEDIKKMQRLAGALVFTSQGIPFIQGGTEFCRTKNENENSYRSPDVINQIDWSLKKEYRSVYEYFRALIRLRKNLPGLRIRSSDEIRKYLTFPSFYHTGLVSYIIKDYPAEKKWKTIQLIYNANVEPVKIELTHETTWIVLAEGEDISCRGIRRFEGNEITVQSISMTIVCTEKE